MTTIETPPATPPSRSGFYVAPWILAVVGGLALLVIGFVIGRAVGDDHHDRGRFFRDHGGGGHPGVRLLVLLVVVALVVAAIVALVRHFSARDAAAATAAVQPSSTAEQLLAERFARGEIDEAEFVSRRDALRG